MPIIKEKKDVPAVDAPSSKKVWLWSVITIAAAFAVLTVSMLAYVMSAYKSVYPNVYADGVRLGGLSEAQADQAVLAHIRDKLSDFSVKLEFEDISHTFTIENINAEYDSGATAQQAHNIGRAGGFFRRLGEISKAYFSRVDIEVTPKLNTGRGIVAEQTAAMARQIDIPVRMYSYVINERDIVIQNASAGRVCNQTAAVEGVMSRFETLESGIVRIEPDTIEPDPLDVDNLRGLIYKEPLDAFIEASSEVKIMPHQTGVDFDVNFLRSELLTDKPEIVVPLIFTEPEITQTELRESLFRDELSSFTTYLSASNVPRTDNIRLAACYINDMIILPGDVFSFNETVGQRTEERGFQEAGAFINGQLVPEFGGGVCQMSTTTYNAALFANLKIVERSNHSLTVSYVNLGQDAMVNWGTSDLRFENDTKYPIQLRAVQSANYIRVTIMGTKTVEQTVEIERNTLSSSPQQRIELINPELAPGKSVTVQDGHNGYVVETYRIVKNAGGKEISRDFEAKSTYRKMDLIIETGPSAATGDASPTSL